MIAGAGTRSRSRSGRRPGRARRAGRHAAARHPAGTGPGGGRRARRAPARRAPADQRQHERQRGGEHPRHPAEDRMATAPRSGHAVDRRSSTGTISASTNSRIAQAGHDLAGEQEIGRRSRDVGSGVERVDRLQHGAAHPGDPLGACRLVGAAGPAHRTATSARRARRSAPNGPCSVAVNGNARCANWPPRLVRPGAELRPAATSAAATVLRSIGGATTWAFDHGTTTGWRSAGARQVAQHDHGVDRLLQGSDLASASAPDGAGRAAGRGEHDRAVMGLARRGRGRARARAVPDSLGGARASRARRDGRRRRSLPLVSPGRIADRRSRACARRRPSAPGLAVDTENPSDASTVPTCVAIASSAGEPGTAVRELPRNPVHRRRTRARR